jgi:hypothetical protein
VDLRWVDLQKADLQEVDLRGANLREADLREADLLGVDLRGADLRRVDLRRAVAVFFPLTLSFLEWLVQLVLFVVVIWFYFPPVLSWHLLAQHS